MNTKFTLAIIALIGIGVFALPSTMSLFSGQHTFYNIDATGNQVPCIKCHGDVKAELSGSMATAGSKAPHADFKCEYCHRAEAGFASGDDAYAKITYRDATGASIYLVTTIQNFETGNYPKNITYQTGMTVDNWNADVFNLDGTPFVNKTEYLLGGLYSGNLYSGGTAGQSYAYAYASEISTRKSDGTPKDNTTTTQNNAFNPRLVTWSGSAEILDGAGSSEVTPGTRYHAASLVSCMECHGGEQKKGAIGYEIETAEPYNHAAWLIDPTSGGNCGNCHYGSGGSAREFALAAGGFQSGGVGLTTGSAEEGAVEAHNEFVTADSNGVLRTAVEGYGASNIACVACHTHVAVDINFQKAYKVAFNANASGTGSWDVGGFVDEGDVNIAVYGNQSGATYATGDKSFTWTIGEMYVNGAASKTNLVLNADSSDNLTALTT